MSFNAGWNRPSSLLLLAVLAANLLLPLAHFWPAGASERPASPVRRSLEVVSPAAVVRIEPIYPVVPRRVAHRRPAPVCRAWGPFTDMAQAEALAARLQLASGSFEVLPSAVRERAEYLVTVLAPGSWQAANRMIGELAARQIDSQLLGPRADVNVLAAGVFSGERRAETQRRRLEDLGYQASVQPLRGSRPSYHLLARIPVEVEPEIPPSGACSDIAPLQQFL